MTIHYGNQNKFHLTTKLIKLIHLPPFLSPCQINSASSQLLWKTFRHALDIRPSIPSIRLLKVLPLLSIARYSFIQLSELEQCRVNKLTQGYKPGFGRLRV